MHTQVELHFLALPPQRLVHRLLRFRCAIQGDADAEGAVRARHPVHLCLHAHSRGGEVKVGEERGDAPPDGFARGVEIIHERCPDVDGYVGKTRSIAGSDLREPGLQAFSPDGVVFVALASVAGYQFEIVYLE